MTEVVLNTVFGHVRRNLADGGNQLVVGAADLVPGAATVGDLGTAVRDLGIAAPDLDTAVHGLDTAVHVLGTAVHVLGTAARDLEADEHTQHLGQSQDIPTATDVRDPHYPPGTHPHQRPV